MRDATRAVTRCIPVNNRGFIPVNNRWLRNKIYKNEIFIFFTQENKEKGTIIWKEQINDILRHAIF